MSLGPLVYLDHKGGNTVETAIGLILLVLLALIPFAFIYAKEGK